MASQADSYNLPSPSESLRTSMRFQDSERDDRTGQAGGLFGTPHPRPTGTWMPHRRRRATHGHVRGTWRCPSIRPPPLLAPAGMISCRCRCRGTCPPHHTTPKRPRGTGTGTASPPLAIMQTQALYSVTTEPAAVLHKQKKSLCCFVLVTQPKGIVSYSTFSFDTASKAFSFVRCTF
jgi:hypothetical protein